MIKQTERTSDAFIDDNLIFELLENSKGFSLEEFVKHVIPKSLFEALATNEILQIVIFSILFGVALAAFSKKEANRWRRSKASVQDRLLTGQVAQRVRFEHDRETRAEVRLPLGAKT